jgi:hypothetical protein
MPLSIPSKNLKNQIVFRIIKSLDIGLITVIYFSIGFILSHQINKIYTLFDNTKTYNKQLLLLEVCTQLFIIGILVYIIRNFVQLIPSPLNGIYGFQHIRVKELNSGGIALAFGIFFAQYDIKDKLKYILDK